MINRDLRQRRKEWDKEKKVRIEPAPVDHGWQTHDEQEGGERRKPAPVGEPFAYAWRPKGTTLGAWIFKKHKPKEPGLWEVLAVYTKPPTADAVLWERGPTDCFRDYTIADDWCWFIRYPGEYRDGPFLEETARLIYKQAKERRAAHPAQEEKQGAS